MSFFDLKILRKKTHKVQRNSAPSKTFKDICFWDKKFEKQTKIATHMQFQKSITINK